MLELRRGLVFGQYVDISSPLQTLDPRVKLLATAALVAVALIVGDWSGFAVLAPLVVALQMLSRVPFGYLLRGSRLLLIFLVVILALQVLFYPTAHGSPVLWRWEVLSVSAAGLSFAGLLLLRVAILFWAPTLLLMVTPVVDLSDALESLFRPLQRVGVPVNELALVGTIAFKFVPIFTDEAERLATARAARGAPVDAGGPINRGRQLGRLLVPIFIGGFRRADMLTIAMDSRCYRGGANRTKLRRLRADRWQWVMLTIMVAWCAAAWLVSIVARV